MSDMTQGIILLVIGGVVTFCCERVVAHFNEKRKRFRIFRLAFRGFPEFHRQLFYQGLTDDLWQAHIPPRLRDHCITFIFFLESVGRAIAKDVKITVHAKNGTGIVAHQFQVAKTAICSRLETKTVEDKELIATWKYINPGDDIELHVLVTGIDDPNDVEIAVDGEGVETTERFLQRKAVRAVVCVGETPIASSGEPTDHEKSRTTASASIGKSPPSE